MKRKKTLGTSLILLVLFGFTIQSVAALINSAPVNLVGKEVGSDDFRITRMGQDTNPAHDVDSGPDITFDSKRDEFFLVWSADDNEDGVVNNEREIFGISHDANTFAPVGSVVRISDMGPTGDTLYWADDPAVAYNMNEDEYMVVWEGTDNSAGQVAYEREIFGLLLDGSHSEIGSNDFAISDNGPVGDTDFVAENPDVAFDHINNQYLVVWSGDDDTAPLVDNEFEIFGVILDEDGDPVGAGPFRISDAGTPGDTSSSAQYPRAILNPDNEEYLVIWSADDLVGGMVAGEIEIFGQLLDESGNEIGTNDFRISDMGGTGDSTFGAHLHRAPSLAYDTTNDHFLVVWLADDNAPGMVDDEFEVFGQLLKSDGGEIGSNDFRISWMGPDGEMYFGVNFVNLAYDTVNDLFLITWEADHHTAGLVEGEHEIYVQLLDKDANLVGISSPQRISDVGPVGDTLFDARAPGAAFYPDEARFLIAWYGDDDVGTQVEGEDEIHGQFFDIVPAEQIYLPIIRSD